MHDGSITFTPPYIHPCSPESVKRGTTALLRANNDRLEIRELFSFVTGTTFVDRDVLLTILLTFYIVITLFVK